MPVKARLFCLCSTINNSGHNNGDRQLYGMIMRSAVLSAFKPTKKLRRQNRPHGLSAISFFDILETS